MLLTERDEAQAMEPLRAQGRAESILEALAGLVRNQVLSARQAAERARLSDAALKPRAGLAWILPRERPH